ncbi:hypothetical protein [Actinomadura oligospora]|uniref:hypothetical protein n=1 Tax=Actinomadura oligospora TaxID=111804 RepID=UPI0004B3CA7B|nr:hypothetical protein [Actinomadura oligospora]
MAIRTECEPKARAANPPAGAGSPIARKAVMLGSAFALTLGVLTAPAQAATAASSEVTTATTPSSTTVRELAATWHFWKSYWLPEDCMVAGYRVLRNHRYQKAKCVKGTGTDHRTKWHLYILY